MKQMKQFMMSAFVSLMAVAVAFVAETAQAGIVIKPTAVTSSKGGDSDVIRMINASGFTDANAIANGASVPAPWPGTGTTWTDNWRNNWTAGNDTNIFTLAETYTLSGVHYWNYNEGGETARGASNVVISVSSDGGSTWTEAGTFVFAKASGTGGYTGADISFSTTHNANMVRFVITQNWLGNNNNPVGLSEIRFVGDVLPIAASFTAASTNGYAPLKVVFTDFSATGGAAITNRHWVFGDGNTLDTTATTVTNTYTRVGSHTVSLTVANNVGDSSTSTRTKLITVQPGHVIKPTAATASSADTPALNMINASEFSAGDANAITNGASMPVQWPGGGTGSTVAWRSFYLDIAARNETNTFMLDKTYLLSGVHYWNYNENGETARGASNVVISVSSDGGTTWAEVGSFVFAKASGAGGSTGADASFPTNNSANAVKFVITSRWNTGANYTGLSEIRFIGFVYEPPVRGTMVRFM
jgi:PKD repeat protein